MEYKRVVVTGLGVVTPVGLNKDEFWSSLINGVSGIGPITRFDAAAFPTRIAAEVKGFDPLLYMDRKAAKRTDRFAQLALAAAKQAFDDAKVDGDKLNKNRVGTFIGSGIGGMETMEEQHKILLSWELHDEEARMEDGRPMTVHQRYTWSMHEKATLRKHLEAWRGAKFRDTEFGDGGFDVRNLLNKSCLVSIEHNEGKNGGNTYANVTSVTKLPKGLAVGKLINPTRFLSLANFDQEAFDDLPEGIQNTIKKSPEWHELAGAGRGVEAAAASGRTKTHDDEIPF